MTSETTQRARHAQDAQDAQHSQVEQHSDDGTQPGGVKHWVKVEMPDGSQTEVRVFHAADYADPAGDLITDTAADTAGDPAADTVTAGTSGTNGTSNVTTPLVIIWPGWAMGARYYEPIARSIASHGYHVAIGELRGQGKSTARADRYHNWGYHHIASQDYPRTIRAVKEHLQLPHNHPTFLLCHSMGGQMAALFLARPEAAELNIRGVMGVGAGTPYYRGFTGKQRLAIRIGAILMRTVANLRGYQPEGPLDIAGYGRQARDHVREWTIYAQTNRMNNLSGQDMHYEEHMAKVTTPILLTRFSNDEDCPIRSCQHLLSKLPRAAGRVEQFPQTLGHNRWAREPDVVTRRFIRFVQEAAS